MDSTNFLRETIDLVRQIETRFLELGSRLYKIKEKRLWAASYDTYEEFLESAKVSPSNASMLASIHKHYVVDGQIPQAKLVGIGYSTLYEAIPLIESNGVTKVVEMARTLTRSEIKDEVREERHGECVDHEPVTICTKCHHRLQ